MVVYLAPLFFLLWALSAQIRRNKQADATALAACTLAIILITGLRWYSDVDYDGYAGMYNDTPTLSEFDQESVALLYGEVGYYFLSAIFKSLGSGFVLFAFACALSALFWKSVVLRKLSGQASLAMCLYLCLHFITIEFIQMRWAVATALLSLGFCFQHLRKYKTAVLCFALAPAFHYFSFLFWVVALLLAVKGYRRFYLLYLASLLAAPLLKIEYLGIFLISDSNLQVLRRLGGYAADPESYIGVFSYAKLIMYPVIYGLCVWYRPTYPWKRDRLNLFLFKLSFVSLSVTLLVTFLPILHYRATVLADFFSIVWILNAMDKAFDADVRMVSFGVLSFLFAIWYCIDLSNNLSAHRLYEYHTWLTVPAFCVLLAIFLCLACIKLWKGGPGMEVPARP